MAASTFRADHVGSLLRPHELHDLREQVRLGKADAAKLKEAEDRLIREAVKLQEDLGLPSITDGEFRRDWWHIDFLAGFDGIELQRRGRLLSRRAVQGRRGDAADDVRHSASCGAPGRAWFRISSF